MPKVSKAEMVAELARLGEIPPKQWTMVELATRLDELRAERGLPPFGQAKSPTPLRKEVVRLNEASKKKSTLQEYVQQHLRLPISGNETILQLQKYALTKIYQITEASAEDPVGFGSHASLTYQEVMEQQPKYVEWCLTMAKEGQTDPRLARLAEWAQQQQEPEMFKKVNHPPAATSAEMEAKGYMQSGQKMKKKAAPSVTSSVSESVTSSQMAQTQAMIQQLANVVTDLKDEIQQVKQELPRKETKKETDAEMGSNSSFSLVTK